MSVEIKKFEKFNLFQYLTEDIDASTFKTIPEGSEMPTSGVVKLGIDPTSDKLHLGHLIPIRMVKKLKENGMDVHIILGTFTAQMGDPSGKDTMRPILSLSATKANADSIISQMHRVLGEDITIHYNHEWFNQMTLPEIMRMLSKYTVDFLMSRDAFQKRQTSGNPIGMHELIVPLLQGLDSVQLNANVEVGGTDQLFNFLLSRDVQAKMGQTPEICFMSPVINGTDGRKMSKSYNNCIYINDSPKDVFGKVLSISDTTMHEWYPLFIENYDKEGHPMTLKKALAVEVTNIIWGPGSGEKEKEAFEKVTSGSLPEDIKDYPLVPLVDFIANMAKLSKGDSRRLVTQGAVSVAKSGSHDLNKVGLDYQIEKGDVIKAGKRNYGRAV